MKDRLADVVKYKTGGRQVDFCELMGWSPQYLAKLLRGESLGISPVVKLLEVMPEINARWFLLGEGEMVESSKLSELRCCAFAQAQALLDMERYISVMTPDELRQFESTITGGRIPAYGDDIISDWEARLNARNENIKSRIAVAAAKSDELCRQRIAKK